LSQIIEDVPVADVWLTVALQRPPLTQKIRNY